MKTLNKGRTSFPEDEQVHPWLTMLLEAYSVVDEGIQSAIKKHERKTRTRLACHKGCFNCCLTHKDIPVYPLELVGIYWYAAEKIKGSERQTLKKQLLGFNGGPQCPFLVDKACSIHQMRPIACRQFNVFVSPCSTAEDPYYTRREQVLTPPREITDRAFTIMMPFYGVTGEEEIRNFVKNNLLHTQVKVLQSLRWDKLAIRMDEADIPTT